MKEKIIGAAVFLGGVGAFLLMDRLLHVVGKTDACTPATAMRVTAVTFRDDGVYPPCSVFASGSEVVWVNASSHAIEVSSDPHPVHSDNSEVSDGKFVLSLEPGQQASVRPTRTGTFGFHDHVRPSLTGHLIIQ